MHNSHSLSSIRGLHLKSSEDPITVLVYLCMCELAWDWHSIKMQDLMLQYPKMPEKKGSEICLSVPLHSFNWSFLQDANDTTTHSLHSDKHRAIYHRILWCCVTALKLFELHEPINFAAHELSLICELEFDFRRHHDLIICVHTCSSVPLGLTKGKE